MKKIIVSILVLSAIIFSGCSSGNNDPKTVLSNFFEALAKKDFTAAKKFTTKDSEGMLNMVQMGMQQAPDTSQTMKFDKENLELGTVAINGDVATIPVKEKVSGEITDFTLKKEGGGWKVAFDKSTLMEMAQKKMKDHGYGQMPGGMNDSSNNMDQHAMPGMDSTSGN